MPISDHLCHYCGTAPATAGYLDVPASLHCDACYLIRMLHDSVHDILPRIRAADNHAILRRALVYETKHSRRTVVLQALERRIRALSPERSKRSAAK